MFVSKLLLSLNMFVYKLLLSLNVFVSKAVTAADAPALHKVNQCQGKISQAANEAKINHCGNKDQPTVNQRRVREKKTFLDISYKSCLFDKT